MGVPFHEIRQWSSAEICLYMCYYDIAPWGEYRADVRNAMRMQQYASAHGGKGTIDDYMPFKDKPPETDAEPGGMRDMFVAMVKKDTP